MFVANQASVLFVVISMNHVGLCGCVPTYFTLAKSLNKWVHTEARSRTGREFNL